MSNLAASGRLGGHQWQCDITSVENQKIMSQLSRNCHQLYQYSQLFSKILPYCFWQLLEMCDIMLSAQWLFWIFPPAMLRYTMGKRSWGWGIPLPYLSPSTFFVLNSHTGTLRCWVYYPRIKIHLQAFSPHREWSLVFKSKIVMPGVRRPIC